MKYCQSCNHPLEDNALFCGNCGTACSAQQAPVQQVPVQEAPVQQAPVQEAPAQETPAQQPVYAPPVQQQPVYTQPANSAYYAPPVQQPAADTDPYDINVTHKGFWSLGFFFGIVGLIMYFVFKSTKPRLAKSAMKGFIAGLIFTGVIFTIYIIILVAAAMM